MQSDLDTENVPSVDWAGYYHAVRDRIWVVFLVIALAAAGAYAYLKYTETFYYSTSVLFFSDQESKVVKNMESVTSEEVKSQDMINTIVEVLGSNPFALRIVDRLKLDTDPEFLKSIKVTDKKIDRQEAAEKLAAMINPQFRKGTRLIDINVTNRNPELAKTLANTYAKEYLGYSLDKRTEATEEARKFLGEEEKKRGAKLRESEEALQRFREKERTASLEALQQETQTRLNVISETIAKLEQSLQQLQADEAAAKATPDAVEELLRLPSIANEPRIAKLSTAISEQQREFAVLSQRYRWKHPTYIAAKTALDSAIADRALLLKDVVPILETTEKQTLAQIAQAKENRVEWEQRMVQVTGKSIEYNELVRQLTTNQTMYTSILERLREVEVTGGLSEMPIEVHELASVSIPTKPSAIKIWIISLIGGAVLGVAIAAGIHAADQSIKTVDEAESTTGLDVIAAVPLISAAEGKQGLVVATQRDGIVAESFRTLRTSLTVTEEGEEDRRVFIFTSALPGEGKTFSSSNFAATLAQQEFRTLIIDADLRKPKISTLFFKENRKPGLADVLGKKVALKEALIPSDVPNLTVLTAGERVVNPSELLGSSAFGQLVEEALTTFDRVVIDSAPCIAVSDTRLLLPYADATCLVLGAFSTPKRVVKRAIKLITEAHTRPVGVILNRLPIGRGGYYSYYYSGTYGGDEVYGETAGKKA